MHAWLQKLSLTVTELGECHNVQQMEHIILYNMLWKIYKLSDSKLMQASLFLYIYYIYSILT